MFWIIDGETQCDRDLGAEGVYRYFDSPQADVYTVQAMDSTKPGQFIAWRRPEPCPPELAAFIRSGGLLVAHNAEFEYLAINKVLAPRYGWPTVSLSQMRCSAALARANGLPGALGLAAQCLELPVQKDGAGHALMLKNCRPGPITDEDMERLIEYCQYDVLTTATMVARLPPWTEYQQRVWETSTRINQRGVRIDKPYAYAAAEWAEQARDDSDRLLSAYTLDEVERTTQTVALKAWINKESDLSLTSVAVDVLEDVDTRCVPNHVAGAIGARLASRAAAVGKYKAALAGLSEDGRFRGAFLAFGAPTTGRFTSRRLQLHNMRRGTSEDYEFDYLHTALCFDDSGLDCPVVTLENIARNVRRMIIPAEGNVLLKADWSQIEARVAPWLALYLNPSAKELLKVFEQGIDVYKYTAASMFHVELDAVDKPQRFAGKVAQLSLGYQGSWRAFSRMAKAYGGSFSESKAREIVAQWRGANPWALMAWETLEQSAMGAVAEPGQRYTACRCHFDKPKDRPFLYCTLPSGRRLAYPYPALEADEKGVQLTYRKAMARPKAGEREWPRTQLYGGKLLENVTQAVAADVLLDTLIKCEADGRLPVVLHVHDEPVAEVPERYADMAAETLHDLMTAERDWAPGLPLAADVQILERYK